MQETSLRVGRTYVVQGDPVRGLSPKNEEVVAKPGTVLIYRKKVDFHHRFRSENGELTIDLRPGNLRGLTENTKN